MQLGERLRQRDVLPEAHELPGNLDRLGRLEDRAAALSLDFTGGGQQPLDRAVLVDELGGGLGADAGHARDVIDAVPHEREHVADALRRHAELLVHLGRAEAAVLHGVEHRDVAVAELHEVLVRRADDDLHPGRDGEFCERGDDVVGLEPRDLDLGQAEGVDHAPDHPDLLGELGRHGRAVRLVGAVELLAEVVAGGVVDYAEVGGALLTLDAQDHLAEAVDRARLHPLRRMQRRQRVERAIEVVHRVQHVEARLGSGRRRDGFKHRTSGFMTQWSSVAEGPSRACDPLHRHWSLRHGHIRGPGGVDRAAGVAPRTAHRGDAAGEQGEDSHRRGHLAAARARRPRDRRALPDRGRRPPDRRPRGDGRARRPPPRRQGPAAHADRRQLLDPRPAGARRAVAVRGHAKDRGDRLPRGAGAQDAPPSPAGESGEPGAARRVLRDRGRGARRPQRHLRLSRVVGARAPSRPRARLAQAIGRRSQASDVRVRRWAGGGGRRRLAADPRRQRAAVRSGRHQPRRDDARMVGRHLPRPRRGRHGAHQAHREGVLHRHLRRDVDPGDQAPRRVRRGGGRADGGRRGQAHRRVDPGGRRRVHQRRPA